MTPHVRPAVPAIAAVLALAAPACAGQAGPGGTATGPGPTIAQMRTAEGKEVGTVTFVQTEQGVIVSVKVKDLAPGKHGFHIHETGACTPDFQAAGGHFNPRAVEHGFHTAGGYHAGDLPNLDVGADGTAEAEFFVPQVTIAGPASERLPYSLSDADGAAMMIHAATDDYRTMASSGGRLACGVIVAKK